MPKRRPALGEETAVQKVSRGEVCAAISAVKGYDAPPAGTIKTYRSMRANPTIALARTVATMPVRTADVSFEANGKGGDEHVEFVKGVMEPMWPRLLKDILFALDYGFAAFEKVWEVRGGKMVYGKVKPLLPENTSILETSKHGIFGGLRQGMIDLPTNKCFIFAYDEEAGSKYGRSRHENIRKVWSEWDQIVEREGQYATKVASIIPRVEYPEGKSEDSTGEEFDNVELAKRVLENLCAGKGVAMPNTLAQYAHDLIRGGVDITKLKAWNIDFLETTGTHAAGLEALLRHKESLMLRGWLVPERAAIEGTHGTLAEADAHGDVGVSVAELLLDEVLRSVNDYLINPLLIYNYGPALEGGVYMSTAGISAEQKAFTRLIIQGVLAQPTNIDLFLRLIDYDALLDQVGLPKAAEVVDIGKWKLPGTEPEKVVAPAVGDEDATVSVVPAIPSVTSPEPDKVQDTAFNGAQISSAIETLTGIADGVIAAEAGSLVLQHLLRIPKAVAEQMVKAQEGRMDDGGEEIQKQAAAIIRTINGKRKRTK